MLELELLVLVLMELEALELEPPAPAPDPLADELAMLEDFDDERPQAAMNAANPVAAAPAPMRLPAILRNFLRSTSSRASCSTTPVWTRSSSVRGGSVITSPWWSGCVRPDALGIRLRPESRSLSVQGSGVRPRRGVSVARGVDRRRQRGDGRSCCLSRQAG